MGFRVKWPFSFSREKKKGPKSVNIFLGFFFVVNYCLGTGFLGVPFSFFYAGYLAAIPTLLLIVFVSWNNAEWEVETMARAQAIESWEKGHRKRGESVQSDSESERERLITESGEEDTTHPHPRYEIRLTRKFEPTELCEIFLTRWGKGIYIVILTIYCFLACWSFTTVAGSAWASNIPFNTSTLDRCDSKDFNHVLIPSSEPCRNAYRLSVFFFAVLAIPLSLLDLKEQAILQMILGLLRFATIAGILVFVIVRLGEGGSECTALLNETNTTFQSVFGTTFTDNNSNIWEGDYSNVVFRFDAVGWLVSIPVFAYAFILHQGIPTLTHPIREKHLLRQLMVAMFSIAAISYLSLGVVVPLWFQANTQETCTLNWVPFLRDPSVSPALQALSYYLVLFPSIDVISAYPLTIHAISNNIFMIICGRDTSRKSKHPTRDGILQYTIKFLSAILPIVAALFVSNLVYVLKYAGITGFFICFLFPTALQLRSIWVCSKEFGVQPVTVEMKKIGEGSVLKGEKEGDEDEKEADSGSTSSKKDWRYSFSLLKKSLSRMFNNYQTPYSNRFLSHPVVVCVIGGVGVLLFLLGILSLGVHPEPIFCADEP
jgi:hypothetical protein